MNVQSNSLDFIRTPLENQDSPSGTPPVETTTSRNNNARKNSPNFHGNPHKLRRILQISTKFRKTCSIFAEICGNLQNSAQFVGISAKILRNFASIFVSTGRCFDWWFPAWSISYRVALQRDMTWHGMPCYAASRHNLIRAKINYGT